MSEVTLLSFVLYQGRKPLDARSLPPMFLAGLTQLLGMMGAGASEIEKTVQCYRQGLFSKTDSRKVLGSMNDLVHCYCTMIEAQGGLAACDMTETIMRINGMPQRTLHWSTSCETALSRMEAEHG